MTCQAEKSFLISRYIFMELYKFKNIKTIYYIKSKGQRAFKYLSTMVAAPTSCYDFSFFLKSDF